jgi:hypothetical protein
MRALMRRTHTHTRVCTCMPSARRSTTKVEPYPVAPPELTELYLIKFYGRKPRPRVLYLLSMLLSYDYTFVVGKNEYSRPIHYNSNRCKYDRVWGTFGYKHIHIRVALVPNHSFTIESRLLLWQILIDWTQDTCVCQLSLGFDGMDVVCNMRSSL